MSGSRSQLASLLGPPVQIAYAVPNAIEAAETWASTFGAGPFFVRPHIPVVDVVHRGHPATFDHTSAYGQWGSVMVELVEDHSTESAIRDMYEPGQSGLHHLAFLVDDLDSVVKGLLDRGYELAQSARTVGGTAFHFIDAVATHGHMFELYERGPRALEFYGQIAHAAVGWDGEAPIRML